MTKEERSKAKHITAVRDHIHKHIEELVRPCSTQLHGAHPPQINADDTVLPLHNLTPALFEELCRAGTVETFQPFPDSRYPSRSPSPDPPRNTPLLFPRFPLLPARARKLIWKHAYTRRTLIPRHSRGGAWAIHLRPPAIYFVNREARKMAMSLGRRYLMPHSDGFQPGWRPQQSSWFGEGDILDLTNWVKHSDSPVNVKWDHYLRGLGEFISWATVIQIDIRHLKRLWLEMTAVRFNLSALRTVRVVADFRCAARAGAWDARLLAASTPLLASVSDGGRRGALLPRDVERAYAELCRTKQHARLGPAPELRRPPSSPDDLRGAVAHSIAYARRVLEMAFVVPSGDNVGLMPRCYADPLDGARVRGTHENPRMRWNGVFNVDGTFNRGINWVNKALDDMPRLEVVIDLGVMDLTGKEEYDDVHYWETFKDDHQNYSCPLP
jgi:2EXR family